MQSFIPTFCFALLFGTCQLKKEDETVHKKINTETAVFQDLTLHGPNDTLSIRAIFDECGEWGGHFEKIQVYQHDTKTVHLNYKKYRVDCETMNNETGNPVQTIEGKQTIKLLSTHKKALFDFIQRMVKSKMEETHPGHAGCSFSVINSDKTLAIKVYDNKKF